MSQAQARQTPAPDEQPAANVNPEQREREREREDESRAEDDEGELEQLDLDDEEDIGRRAVEILSRVRRGIREQPLTAAGGAFILGFAIGNGVPKFLARAGIAIGLRMVMQRMFDRSDLFEDEI